jgi:hypothetical protein
MVNGRRVLVSLLAVGLLSTAALARAEDSVRDVIEREVPVMKDGTRLALADIERAILGACARNKFRCRVIEPGVISARRSRWFKPVEVKIPYSDAGFAIQFDSERVDVAHNQIVVGLVEVIEADLASELVRVKSLQKPVRRSARLNPRRAV